MQVNAIAKMNIAPQTAPDTASRTKDLAMQEEKQLKAVCKQFESLFVSMLMRQMRASIPKSGLIDGGNAEAMFQDMQDEQFAREVGGSGAFGLGDVLFKQLKQNIGVPKNSALNEYEKHLKAQGQKIDRLNTLQ